MKPNQVRVALATAGIATAATFSPAIAGSNEYPDPLQDNPAHQQW